MGKSWDKRKESNLKSDLRRVYNILCKFKNSRINKIDLEERTDEYAFERSNQRNEPAVRD